MTSSVGKKSAASISDIIVAESEIMRAVLILLWPVLMAAQNTNSAFVVLHSFSGEDGDGAYPGAPLLIGPSGALFGTTARGGILSGISGAGMVFELTPPISPGAPWIETVIHTFGSGSDGVQPNAGLVVGPNGSYYSTTFGGGGGAGCTGYSGCGTVYELTPPAVAGGAWTETVLYSFDGSAHGAVPSAPVLFGAGGQVYGTTAGGPGSCPGSGVSGCGVVFELRPRAEAGNSWSERVLHQFGKGDDGMYPFAGLVAGKGGSLYGTTLEGGTYKEGIVFELKPPAAEGEGWPKQSFITSPTKTATADFQINSQQDRTVCTTELRHMAG